MISICQHKRSLIIRLLTGIVVLTVVSACTKDEATDYCKNHYVFHFEHKDQLSTLNMEVAKSGLVTAVLTLKGDLAREYKSNQSLQQTLMDADSIYSIVSKGGCSDALVIQSYEPGYAQGTSQHNNPESQAALATLTFETQCTAGIKIDQVDVALFDTIPDLDEIEATITTSATRKHFAISRQCDGAIYRLAKKQDKT